MKSLSKYLLLMACCLVGSRVLAQDAKSVADTLVQQKSSMPQVSIRALVAKADSLRMKYDFEAAVALLESAKKNVSDSVTAADVDNSLMLARNAVNMLGYCSRPVVVAKQRFSLEDFFLFYPLPDNSWRPLPNRLDSLADGSFPKAVYFPENAGTIYYSAKDADGSRNIYKTDYQDSIWSAPALVNEQLMSLSDEIFPMLSEDGQSLYFASKGLYGMGGYDLYVSNWNKELNDWDVPVNMGFPYSSPYDDFLFINTPDGRYSMFASNRETTRDSVYIYVLEYDGMPVRKAVSDREELLKMVSLDPVKDPSRLDNGSVVAGKMPDSEEARKYSDKMKEVRALKNKINAGNLSIESLRSALADAEPNNRKSIEESILENEAAIQNLQDSLSYAVRQLQKIEIDFLVNGTAIDLQKIQEEADKEVVGASAGYTFSSNSMGRPFNMKVARPKVQFDYSFKILPEGRFAEDNTLPPGLIYQIQIFSLSSRAEESQLKGLSPVFWRMSSSQKYTYSVGLFTKYEDVLANLNKVKRAGFRNALIVSFNDGKLIPLQQARTIEKTVLQLYQIRIYTSDGQSLADGEMSAVRAIVTKDISKALENGTLSYIIGPFDDKTEADKTASLLRAAGFSNISVELVK